MRDVRFRVSMRTDVWAMIRPFDESLDKMEQYVNDIKWRRVDFRKLLYKRIDSELHRNGYAGTARYKLAKQGSEESMIDLAFVPTMQWGDKETETYRVIYTMSYERPRWAIQLCKLAQQCALQNNDSLITHNHINSVWGEYGSRRIADLVSEHKHQCNVIQELLNAFRGCDRLMSRDGLFTWINAKICQHVSPVIEGQEVKSPRDIAHFLYRLGFIIARSNSEGGYEHYTFDQMPDFLTSRTNDDFNLLWEIHPCYREALDIKKLDRSHKERFAKLRGEDDFVY